MGNVLVAMGLQVTRLIDDEEDRWQSLWRGSAAEFFATAIFVFIGTGSVIAAKSTLGEDKILPASITLIAVSHGFAIMCLVYTVGEISGGHINPAITWALLITDRISITRACVYWVSQFTGGIAGSAILLGLLPPDLEFHMGCHMVNDKLTDWQGLGAEVVFTFIFVLVVFSTAISPFVGKMAPVGGSEYGPGKLTPFAVGMTIMILILVGAPMTGGSMNPARSLGPAIIRGDTCWGRHWVYWFGPLIGSTAAAVVAQVLFLSSPEDIRDMLTATRGVNLMGVSRAIKAAKEDNSLQMDDVNVKRRKNIKNNQQRELPRENLETYVQPDYEPQA